MTRKTTRKTAQTAQAPVNLPHFARKVMEVARFAPESCKFGPNKVYICKAWELGFKDQMTLEQFKEYLKQAHIQGLIYLSRADLIQVMPQDVIRQSEIQWEPGNLSMTSHFILIV